ncbi:MAG TPA: hypothetical protein VMU14_07805, partial [Acidimicrobiales bacterium]|nr:hypothetical protein [Acidimicrobiales bacterium]
MPDHLTVANPLEGVDPRVFTDSVLPVRPWADPLIDTLGFDPRSAYVEQFWLSILGPSTTWLLRRVAAGFDRWPDGFDLPLADTAREIGLGDKCGRHSPFVRALARCCQFELARPAGRGIEVRRKVPPLTRRQVVRLPDALRQAHEAWQAAQVGARGEEAARRSARSVALSMLELDPDASAVEQRLVSWRVHPAVAH